MQYIFIYVTAGNIGAAYLPKCISLLRISRVSRTIRRNATLGVEMRCPPFSPSLSLLVIAPYVTVVAMR